MSGPTLDHEYLRERLTTWLDGWKKHRNFEIAVARGHAALSGEHVDENAILARAFDSCIEIIEAALRELPEPGAPS